jgi:hypothetical protein
LETAAEIAIDAEQEATFAAASANATEHSVPAPAVAAVSLETEFAVAASTHSLLTPPLGKRAQKRGLEDAMYEQYLSYLGQGGNALDRLMEQHGYRSSQRSTVQGMLSRAKKRCSAAPEAASSSAAESSQVATRAATPVLGEAASRMDSWSSDMVDAALEALLKG